MLYKYIACLPNGGSLPGSRFWKKHKLRQLGRPIKARSKAAGRGLPSMVSGNTWKSNDGYGTSVYSSVLSPSLFQHGAGQQRVPTTEGPPDEAPGRMHRICVIIAACAALVHPRGPLERFRSTGTTEYSTQPVFEKNRRMFAPHACRAHACWSSL